MGKCEYFFNEEDANKFINGLRDKGIRFEVSLEDLYIGEDRYKDTIFVYYSED